MTDPLTSLELPADTSEERIVKAIAIAVEYGGMDGAHHKAWTIDQMVRALTGCPRVTQEGSAANGMPCTFVTQGESAEYQEVVAAAREGEDCPETYPWEAGIAP